MFDIILIVACVYLVYSNIRSLMEVPFGQWEWAQWLLALVSVLLAVAAVFLTIRYFRKSKVRQQEALEKAEQKKAEEEEKRRAAAEAAKNFAPMKEESEDDFPSDMDEEAKLRLRMARQKDWERWGSDDYVPPSVTEEDDEDEDDENDDEAQETADE